MLMKCPYCSLSSNVTDVGVPTVSQLITTGPLLGLGVLSGAAAAALVAAYRITGKRIYKCTECDKYFIA